QRADLRRDAGQRDAVLGDRRRGVIGQVLLGELQAAVPRPHPRPGRLLDIPEEYLPPVPALGRTAVAEPAVLERAGQRRPLRRLRAAGDVRERGPGQLPRAPLSATLAG